MTVNVFKDTNGRKLYIEMRVWIPGQGYSPDWSDDFFCVGLLQHEEDNEGLPVYLIPHDNLGYLVEQAKDWANNRGDSQSDGVSDEDLNDRYVSYYYEEVHNIDRP